MTFVWKDKALRLAGKRGVAKARAYGLATDRRVPITLAKVAWLERPEIPISEREKTGKPPAKPHKAASTDGAAQVTYQRPRRGAPTPAPRATLFFAHTWPTFAREPVPATDHRRRAPVFSESCYQSISFSAATRDDQISRLARHASNKSGSAFRLVCCARSSRTADQLFSPLPGTYLLSSAAADQVTCVDVPGFATRAP